MDPNVRWCPKPGCESPIIGYEVVRPGEGAGAGGLRLALMVVYGALLGRLLDVVVRHSWRALLAETAERIASGCVWGEGKINRVGPDFGSPLPVSSRDSESNCWVNWKIVGQPCEFQVGPACSSPDLRPAASALRSSAASRRASLSSGAAAA
jgi:hypothetical protein